MPLGLILGDLSRTDTTDSWTSPLATTG